MVPKLWLMSALAAASVVAAAHSTAHARDGKQIYDDATIGGAYAAGEAIGAAAVGGSAGYDGGAPAGRPGSHDRACYTRRPVYDGNGTLIGYRGRQIC